MDISRSLARRMAALGAVVPLILMMITGVSKAQTPQSLQVSVSNLDETCANNAIWRSARADWRCAQGFTTGDATDGYTLTSVTARFLDKAGSPGDVVATLHDGKRPDTDDDVALATLSGDNPDTAGEYTFTRYGEGCALAADATRFARFSSTNSTDNNNEYRWNTVLNGFGQTTIPSDNGWTIADELDHRIGSDAWQRANDLAAYLKVSASVVEPTPTTTSTPTATAKPTATAGR